MKKKLFILPLILISAFLTTGCFSDFDEAEISSNNIPAVTESVTEAATETADDNATTEIPTEYATEDETEYSTETFDDLSDDTYVEYYFRSEKLLDQHFEKHGEEFYDDFGYETAEDYERGASDVINDPDALFKYEEEDGDGVYYLEDTNEFVILSTDGYIRTYFRPDSGIDYFNRQ